MKRLEDIDGNKVMRFLKKLTKDEIIQVGILVQPGKYADEENPEALKWGRYVIAADLLAHTMREKLIFTCAVLFCATRHKELNAMTDGDPFIPEPFGVFKAVDVTKDGAPEFGTRPLDEGRIKFGSTPLEEYKVAIEDTAPVTELSAILSTEKMETDPGAVKFPPFLDESLIDPPWSDVPEKRRTNLEDTAVEAQDPKIGIFDRFAILVGLAKIVTK